MSVLATDNFNRADGNIGANWTVFPHLGGTPQIASNRLFNAAGSRRGAYYSAIAWPNDQYSQAKLDQFMGLLFVRAVNIGGEANYYAFQANTLDDSVSLTRYTNNVGSTTLDSDTTTVNVGDIMYLEIQGTSLVAKINGNTVLTATDANFASGSPGVGYGIIGDDALDDWEGGDFAVVGGEVITWLPVVHAVRGPRIVSVASGFMPPSTPS